ncbi:hypothetical protein GINT2_001136 [Glugoides intestinalis]
MLAHKNLTILALLFSFVYSKDDTVNNIESELVSDSVRNTIISHIMTNEEIKSKVEESGDLSEGGDDKKDSATKAVDKEAKIKESLKNSTAYNNGLKENDTGKALNNVQKSSTGGENETKEGALTSHTTKSDVEKTSTSGEKTPNSTEKTSTSGEKTPNSTEKTSTSGENGTKQGNLTSQLTKNNKQTSNPSISSVRGSELFEFSKKGSIDTLSGLFEAVFMEKHSSPAERSSGALG